MGKTRLMGLIVFLGLVLAANAAEAQYTNHYWQGAGTGGNTANDPADPSTQWGEATNWVGDVVPTGGNATAKFWYTSAGATYLGGTVGCQYVYVDGISPDATFYIRDNEELSVNGVYVGLDGIGNLVQSGGTVATSYSVGLGGDEGTIGTYTMYGGELKIGIYGENIGYWGTGRFIQHGGTHTVGELSLSYEFEGQGYYELYGGELNASCTKVGRAYVGDFLQEGGLHSVSDLRIGDSTNSHGTYELRGGNLNVRSIEIVGVFGEGTFIQTGGMHSIGDWLMIGYSDYYSQGSADGSYMLSGGTLNVATTTDVGYKAKGVLDISGNARMVTYDLLLGESGGEGTLKITSPLACLEIEDRFFLGANASLSTVDGATIRMTGSRFENNSADPHKVVGLSRLKMIFEEAGGLDAEFEVACKDMGAVAKGFIRNFALRTLQIGDAETGQVVLLDTFDNYPSWEGDEALYIRNLIVGSGSHLNLNGLKVYYNSLTNQGTIDYNGGELVYAPLPPDILSINASALSSGFVPDGLGSGTLTVSHIADIGVELEDSEIVYSDGLFEMTTLLLADNSADGIASGEFGDGALIIRDGEGADLLTGDLIELELDEVIDGAGVLAGQGLFNVTGGLWEEAFMLPLGEIVQITFQIDPADIDDFSIAFTGVSNITLTPVPEPATLALLALGGLAMTLRRRRKK